MIAFALALAFAFARLVLEPFAFPLHYGKDSSLRYGVPITSVQIIKDLSWPYGQRVIRTKEGPEREEAGGLSMKGGGGVL